MSVWAVSTLNPLDRLTLLGRWKYSMCSFIGSALFYDADSRLPRLSGLDFVLSHQFGIRRTGPQNGSVLTSAGRRRLWQFAAGPPLWGRRDALWEDLGLHADSEPAPHRRDGRDVAETTHGRERLPVISSRLDLWTCLYQPIALPSKLLLVLGHFLHQGPRFSYSTRLHRLSSSAQYWQMGRKSYLIRIYDLQYHISQSTKSYVDGIYLLWIQKKGSSKLLADYENDVI